MAQDNNVQAVLPPVGACCANDLWDITLPKEVEQAGYATHAFDWQEGRCYNCDCRSGGQWSRFACRDTRPDLAMTFDQWAAQAVADYITAGN